MRNYVAEFENRINFIKKVLKDANASGIVFGNSGGKDSALVGILCKAACDNTIGILMPCESKRNFNQDMDDGKAVAKQFCIETFAVDLTECKKSVISAISPVCKIADNATHNIAPRLRMITLYAVAQTRNSLVAGTGNRSEAFMGYFTKWGDGAHDFNPIADLTVTEIYEFLEYLKAPDSIINKAPSAGLFEGQTDEGEMGITYKKIDDFLLNNTATEQDKEKMLKAFEISKHKRAMPVTYKEN